MSNITSVDVGGHRHNYKGSCKNFIYPMSINKGKMTTTQVSHSKPYGNSLLSYLSLVEKALKRRSNHLVIL